MEPGDNQLVVGSLAEAGVGTPAAGVGTLFAGVGTPAAEVGTLFAGVDTPPEVEGTPGCVCGGG